MQNESSQMLQIELCFDFLRPTTGAAHAVLEAVCFELFFGLSPTLADDWQIHCSDVCLRPEILAISQSCNCCVKAYPNIALLRTFTCNNTEYIMFKSLHTDVCLKSYFMLLYAWRLICIIIIIPLRLILILPIFPVSIRLSISFSVLCNRKTIQHTFFFCLDDVPIHRRCADAFCFG